MQNGRFPSKSALCLKKVCYKVSLCQRQVALAYLIGQNGWWWTSKLAYSFKNADFQSIFVRSISV